jgi:hypothetical protein
VSCPLGVYQFDLISAKAAGQPVPFAPYSSFDLALMVCFRFDQSACRTPYGGSSPLCVPAYAGQTAPGGAPAKHTIAKRSNPSGPFQHNQIVTKADGSVDQVSHAYFV